MFQCIIQFRKFNIWGIIQENILSSISAYSKAYTNLSIDTNYIVPNKKTIQRFFKVKIKYNVLLLICDGKLGS